MQKYMTKQQFINFKQWQWCYIFWFSVILIFNVEIKTAIACGLVGAYSLLKAVRWGLFNS